ncbi:MAG: hypothetical protein JOZ41_22645 [Chloroflexi bacterium]|nr:hypothetical protein [Chloroflexota bacterium]
MTQVRPPVPLLIVAAGLSALAAAEWWGIWGVRAMARNTTGCGYIAVVLGLAGALASLDRPRAGVVLPVVGGTFAAALIVVAGIYSMSQASWTEV